MSSGLLTNVKIFLTVIIVLGLYTWVANAIPQVESEVPQELVLTGDASTEELVAAGEELFLGAGGCTACHGLGTRAPNLRTAHAGEGPIGVRCGNRVPGQDCKTYFYESMVNPAAYLVEGFGDIMLPQDRTLSNNQIWVIIAYLESLGGDVTVTSEDIAATASDDDAGGAAGGGASTTSTDPMEIMEANLCLNCHTLEEPATELGPSFAGIGSRLDEAYIRRSILDPNAESDPQWESVKGTMPATFGQLLTAAQLEALVQFLLAQK